ncbi:PASTA domain-containing protein [Streptomyces sp. NPDC006879]|uniref:PASTA domain-containing protein n=1 Tax=Streptomyces sp. NPDC006879 TaxID=3364767 RepID=UPI00369A2FF6
MHAFRVLAPAAALGALLLTGCEGGTASDTSTRRAPSTPTTAPTSVVVPTVEGEAYGAIRDRLTEAGLPAARVRVMARHKDVALPKDHADWRVCEVSPASGVRVAAGATVVLKLAETAWDCAISHHGYLHQKNDPAYRPPTRSAPKPRPTTTPSPVKTRTPTPVRTTARPAQNSKTTCPDGKLGYACTSNGHPVVDGQFCPKVDRGRTLKATNGTMVTCSRDPRVKPYRWQ